MSRHTDPHPLAGKTATIRDGVTGPRDMVVAGAEYRVEDWWDRVSGQSWMNATGNPAAMQYAIRTAGLTPIDDEVVYGKIGAFGHLVHASEIEGG